MKKLTILTSLLALTACGGGSGGGSAPAPVSLNPDLKVSLSDMNFASSDETFKFDVKDGNIVSITMTDEDGTKQTYQHVDGNKFQKNNFIVYEANIDTGDIKDALQARGITYYDDVTTDIVSDTELSPTQKIQALVTSNINLMKKNGVHITQDVIDTLTEIIGNPTWETYNIHSETININSVGKNLKLSYSDFGTMEYNFAYTGSEGSGTSIETDLYVGGHKASEVAKPDTDMTFTGTAIARIQPFGHGDDNPDAMISTTKDAKLQVSGGNETLTMNFTKADKPWYDVVIDGSAHTVDIDVNSTATAKIANGYKATDAMTNKNTSGIEATYYGKNGAATEAVATTRFDLSETGMDVPGISVEAVFGGKAK